MASQKKASDLRANPRNPRKITDKKLSMLKKAMDKYGDLGGIVYNRRSSQIVGGHQRVKTMPPTCDIELSATYDVPTKTGTVADGFVKVGGERFAYREVDWDDATEKAANLAANKGAGEFDLPAVAEWMNELDTGEFDLDLTMFEATERDVLVTPDFLPTEEPPERLDKTNIITCPACSHEFTRS